MCRCHDGNSQKKTENRRRTETKTHCVGKVVTIPLATPFFKGLTTGRHRHRGRKIAGPIAAQDDCFVWFSNKTHRLQHKKMTPIIGLC